MRRKPCAHSSSDLQPLLDVVEGLLVGDVVDHDDAVRAPVVAGGDGTEALLAGRVPDLGGGGGEGGAGWRLTCSLIVLPSSSIVLILKSTPIVEM